MPTTNVPDPIPLTLEDIAHFADTDDELPDDTAARLQQLVLCDDPERFQATWRLIEVHRAALRQMMEDAGVELWMDGIFVFRIFEQLRSEHWENPEDLLHHRVDVPYQALISMAGARARRAASAEKAELEQLIERLTVALGENIAKEKFVTQLIDRLLEVGEEAAEEALNQFLGLYRQRREVAAG